MSSQVLERFHRALIEEIQTQRPDYLTSSFTVAEIYQNLVPYSSHRDRIGVEMNGDYEDALVRLLAGEGGYLILDSEPALRDLRAELESTHPNTGIYREFAAVDVRLNQAYLDLSAAAMDQLPDLVRELEADDPVTMAELAPSEETAGLGIVPPGVDIFAAAPLAEAGAPASTAPSRAGSASAPAVTPRSGHAAPEVTVPIMASASTGGSVQEEIPVPAAHRPPLAPEFVEEPAPPSGGQEARCRSCRSALPDLDEVNFCPFCGIDLRVVGCSACGTTLESAWHFCPTCGTEATA